MMISVNGSSSVNGISRVRLVQWMCVVMVGLLGIGQFGDVGVVGDEFVVFDGEDVYLVDFEFDLVENYFGQQFGQVVFGFVYFVDQQVVFVEVQWCIVEDFQYQVQVVVVGMQVYFWFVGVFWWQGIGFVVGDVWGVGDDQVVVMVGEVVEQVGFDQGDVVGVEVFFVFGG